MMVPHPVVCSSKHLDVVGLDEVLDSVVEKPVRDGWILDDSFGIGGSGVRVIWTASSGHLRSAALCVRQMVGSPSVSTMESS